MAIVENAMFVGSSLRRAYQTNTAPTALVRACVVESLGVDHARQTTPFSNSQSFLFIWQLCIGLPLHARATTPAAYKRDGGPSAASVCGQWRARQRLAEISRLSVDAGRRAEELRRGRRRRGVRGHAICTERTWPIVSPCLALSRLVSLCLALPRLANGTGAEGVEDEAAGGLRRLGRSIQCDAERRVLRPLHCTTVPYCTVLSLRKPTTNNQPD